MTIEPQYSQCKLRKGDTFQVSWIPAKFAQVGRPVALRTEVRSGDAQHARNWDDGWVVVEVGSRLSETQLAMVESRKDRPDSRRIQYPLP